MLNSSPDPLSTPHLPPAKLQTESRFTWLQLSPTKKALTFTCLDEFEVNALGERGDGVTVTLPTDVKWVGALLYPVKTLDQTRRATTHEHQASRRTPPHSTTSTLLLHRHAFWSQRVWGKRREQLLDFRSQSRYSQFPYNITQTQRYNLSARGVHGLNFVSWGVGLHIGYQGRRLILRERGYGLRLNEIY